MLPFKNRLNKRKDHENVQKKGMFVSLDNIALKMLKNTETTETRFGIVVGLKFSPKAIERNYAKREIREAIHKEINQIQKGWDVVIMARKRKEEKIKKIDFKKNIKIVLEKSNLFNK